MSVLRMVPWLAMAFSLASVATAQNFPDKPVRMIVPFPPGGSTDLVARVAGQKLAELWGQQVVIDNRGGAGGTIGEAQVAKAEADGYTILHDATAFSVNPALYQNLSFDYTKDFAPVFLASLVPNILVVNKDVEVKTVADVIELAKKTQGGLDFASSGNGTTTHLGAELFKSMTGVNIVRVSYKGNGPANNDLLAGQINIMFNTLALVAPLARAGRLRALAVASEKRSELMPELPTVSETAIKESLESRRELIIEVLAALQRLGGRGNGGLPLAVAHFALSVADGFLQLIQALAEPLFLAEPPLEIGLLAAADVIAGVVDAFAQLRLLGVGQPFAEFAGGIRIALAQLLRLALDVAFQLLVILTHLLALGEHRRLGLGLVLPAQVQAFDAVGRHLGQHALEVEAGVVQIGDLGRPQVAGGQAGMFDDDGVGQALLALPLLHHQLHATGIRQDGDEGHFRVILGQVRQIQRQPCADDHRIIEVIDDFICLGHQAGTPPNAILRIEKKFFANFCDSQNVPLIA